MNMPNSYHQEQEFEYPAFGERREEKGKSSRSRRMQYARGSRPAVSHNGIHRRRNKRFSW